MYKPNCVLACLADYMLVLVLTAVLIEDKGKIVTEQSFETTTKGQMQDTTHEKETVTMATASLLVTRSI